MFIAVVGVDVGVVISVTSFLNTFIVTPVMTAVSGIVFSATVIYPKFLGFTPITLKSPSKSPDVPLIFITSPICTAPSVASGVLIIFGANPYADVVVNAEGK